MLDVAIPELTFPMVEYSRAATPWDLRVLLYKGGAKSNQRTVFTKIAAGELAAPKVERLELVKRIHEEMTAQLVGGGAKATALTQWKTLRRFVAWAEEGDQKISLETVENIFSHWCDSLLGRVRLKTLKNVSMYGQVIIISGILDKALNRSQPLIENTPVQRSKSGVPALGVKADKQSLSKTFAFGQVCLDVIDSLPFEAIFGPLPVRISTRGGRVIEHWSKLKPPSKSETLQPNFTGAAFFSERVLQRRAAYEADCTLRTRHPVVNLRIEAELMVFIGQTGTNLTQAQNLLITQYSYKSIVDGYEVRAYKSRRKGEVLFEIFSQYKTVFEEYLTWREKVFGTTTDRLFPFVRPFGALDDSPQYFHRLRRTICAPLGVPFVSPQQLRKTRVNWLLRRSRDPDQTAEQAQHTKETLLRIYEKPSLQVAQIEIIQFWQKNDPRLSGAIMPCPAQGSCDGLPERFPDLPSHAPQPDCMNPLGCFFCSHHRDIDSEDYVWSMASMRHLQLTILPRFRPHATREADPAAHLQMVIDVLTAKLNWFTSSNATRKAWVDEAMEKLAEGEYHIHWRYLIDSVEGG